MFVFSLLPEMLSLLSSLFCLGSSPVSSRRGQKDFWDFQAKSAAHHYFSIGRFLNGVGVDGVGVIFPLFYAFFPFFFASPKGQGQTTAIYCKNGEFHSDPVCTDPVPNFPIRELLLPTSFAS